MMRPKLPVVSDIAAYHHYFNDEVWETAAATICARHKISYMCLRRSPQGENIIFFIDDALVIKIFAPFRENFLRETAALEFTHGTLGIETPELLFVGDVEGWQYLIMTKLRGHASREVWESIQLPDRLEIMTRLGVAMNELHKAKAPLEQDALNPDWRGFIKRQALASVERQRVCGANHQWLESLPALISARLKMLPENYEQVFLHGDIHAGNVLLDEEGGHWRVTGLIDFGDSLCGFHEYEFVAPGVLMVQGSRELQRAMLLAYGYTEAQLDLNLRARLMLLTVLYECSDLRKYALRLAPEAVHLTLDELEAAIWAFTT
ncbi:MAG: aminoglycoside phosphotransferase family protein [Acidobacteria bacterium]|jgi:hygromycin-B 7''-O-kinase|nr:aminoglycoside phosphotransferase family protein [Acidobacteriota bacterium]